MEKGYYKTDSGIYVNLDNANYFRVIQSFEDFDKYSVYILFGDEPGYMNKGLIVKDLFNTIEDADNWIKDNLL